jgi:hypothetical protein
MFTVGLDKLLFFILFSQNLAKRLNIVRFSTIEDNNNHIREIIFGSLLGDGKLEMAPRALNARFGFTQSEDKKDYFMFIINSLYPLFNVKFRESTYFDKRTNKMYTNLNF